MTLFKQVALLVSMVFLLIVVTTTVGDFQRSGSFLEGQLQTAAQDMATTLGIAISSSAAGTDKAAYETLFNAVFDSGYYSSIELVAPDGTMIHKKARLLEIEGVPDWFISFVPLWPATGSTQVMQGWVPLGTLRLTLHPGYVYASLYNNLEATLYWFIVLFSFGMMVLWLLLHKLLKPLEQVKEQADAIHRSQFVQQSAIPRTIELRSVVVAMNRMVEKVHMIFDDQEKTLSRYQKLLYEDELTGLGNRKYFMSQLEHAQSEEASFHGSMAVIKIHGFDYLKDHHGYQKTDELILLLAQLLKNVLKKYPEVKCARLAEDEFSLLLAANSDAVVQSIEDIFERFKSNDDIAELIENIYLTAGCSRVHIGHKASETLAGSDFALTQASTKPYSVYKNVSTNISLPQGKMQWRAWLEQCISEARFYLVRQKVMNTNGVAVHQEVFIRLKNDEGQTVPAGMFMPMAHALGLDEHIDRTVFQLMKERGSKDENIPLAVNLTASVFRDADSLIEFNHLLEFFQQSNTDLCVEASHAILEQYPEMCAEIAESVRLSGHVFGIDNLNLGYSLQALQSMRPDYVKVNANVIYDMTTGNTPAAYQALRTLTKTMDIQLIAVAVDSQSLYDHLCELGVNAMQGNLLGQSEEFL